MPDALINLAYLVASILFILGLKGLTHPRTAVRGNLMGAVAMLIAVLATLVHRDVLDFRFIALGLALGAAIGAWLAIKIEMTDMPQLVAVFNGFGGGASVFVAGAALHEALGGGATAGLAPDALVATGASGLIGAVTLLGSYIAFAKLQGIMRGAPISLPGHQALNVVLALGTLAACALLVLRPDATVYWGLVAAASVLGVTLVIPIGGADMPVVIALLNALSGVAAAATGFVLQNNGLIIAGSLVGASGLILTAIMCKAMNRSLANVLFGGVGEVAAGVDADEVYAGKVKSTSADELAMVLDGASRVAIVPGYGMAVAQAQHAVRDLTNLLEERGCEVYFGIHPVAGRMPGHMNVLLAEADIAYDRLYDLDQSNATFEQTDVTIVIGANDVVNPVARTDKGSPIYGMPILDVDRSRTVVVVKRSLSPGFAGIPNPLFAADNSLMFFTDAKKGMLELVTAVKES